MRAAPQLSGCRHTAVTQPRSGCRASARPSTRPFPWWNAAGHGGRGDGARGLFECEANPFLLEGKVHLPGPMPSASSLRSSPQMRSEETPVIFALPYVAQAGETEASRPGRTAATLSGALPVHRAAHERAASGSERAGGGAPRASRERHGVLGHRAGGLRRVAGGAGPAEGPAAALARAPPGGLRLGTSEGSSVGPKRSKDGLEEAFKRRLRGAHKVQVQLRHVRFGGELKDSGRLAVLRQKLPQEALPFGMMEAGS